MKNRADGAWAKKVCPGWVFSLYDCAERLHLSPRHVRRLLIKYGIPTGVISRPVRLRDGRIVSRKLSTITPSNLEQLLLAYGGFISKSSSPARTPQVGRKFKKKKERSRRSNAKKTEI